MATSAVAQTFCSFVSQAVGIGIQDEKWKRISPAATEEDVATNLSLVYFSLLLDARFPAYPLATLSNFRILKYLNFLNLEFSYVRFAINTLKYLVSILY